MELYGYNPEGKLEAIAPLFAHRAAHLRVEFSRDMFHAWQQHLYNTEYNIYPELDIDSIETWKRTISPMWGVLNPKDNTIMLEGYLLESKGFDSFVPSEENPSLQCEVFDMGKIRKDYADENGLVSFFFTPWPELTPFEFFVFPLKATTKKSTNTEAISKVMTDLDSYSEMLNRFYIEKHNQVFLDAVMVLTAVYEHRKPIYAIAESPVHKSNVPRFRRVLIYSFSLVSEHNRQDPASWMMKVVFLDHGGTGEVPLSSLLQIHSKHIDRDPFTVQLICPSTE
ncbi:hypothetical protein L596_014162 [Steinernema carpocapsae]|nr:hypothetical protein L596_014162 [Steinernema carpocapsae]